MDAHTRVVVEEAATTTVARASLVVEAVAEAARSRVNKKQENI